MVCPSYREIRKLLEVEIYTTPYCSFCHRAKNLLRQKGVSFTEIDLLGNPGKDAEMLRRSNGGRKVPQIFIGGRHVGDCNELFELEAEDELDRLLGIA